MEVEMVLGATITLVRLSISSLVLVLINLLILIMDLELPMFLACPQIILALDGLVKFNQGTTN